MKKRPAVGVGVLIIRNDSVLLGKRINAHGENTWAPPGGHLEFAESILECAAREILEETGLMLKNMKTIDFTNDIFVQEDKHYITLFVQAECEHGEPQLLEPHKCMEWRWCDLRNLPEPLFLPLKNLLSQQKKTSLMMQGERRSAQLI